MSNHPTNVFIFGAGCSVDAGIPLLGNFIDRMFEYRFRGRSEGTTIADPVLEVLKESDRIRHRFDKYQSRACFDTRNLEDVLSLLSFERLMKNTTSDDDYNTFVKAIGATIELACQLKYRPEPSLDAMGKNRPYERFCKTLLSNRCLHPAIITFNYDLVFERAIWDVCHFLADNPVSIPDHFSIDYGYGNKYSILLQEHTGYKGYENRKAFKPVLVNKDSQVSIPYYKLHGSLNWSDPKSISKRIFSPTEVCDDPLILPPVFNKMATPDINNVWSQALDAIRHAINIIIVGYSLPKTDIYMQYFLKSAVGPNENLSRIVVFNPVLFEDSKACDEMRHRYAECFSEPFRDRIEYKPGTTLSRGTEIRDQKRGTFGHFERVFTESPENILFMP